MKQLQLPKKAFASLIGLILSLFIIAVLFCVLRNVYFKKSPMDMDKRTRESLLQEGVDTTSYRTIVDTTREKVKGINKKMLEEKQGM